jgi:hypothetical protein
MEGDTVITKLEYRKCSFSAGDCAAIMANSLTRNTSVDSISVERPLDLALCLSAFRIGITAMLQDNTSTESLSILYEKMAEAEELVDRIDTTTIWATTTTISRVLLPLQLHCPH